MADWWHSLSITTHTIPAAMLRAWKNNCCQQFTRSIDRLLRWADLISVRSLRVEPDLSSQRGQNGRRAQGTGSLFFKGKVRQTVAKECMKASEDDGQSSSHFPLLARLTPLQRDFPSSRRMFVFLLCSKSSSGIPSISALPRSALSVTEGSIFSFLRMLTYNPMGGQGGLSVGCSDRKLCTYEACCQ